MNLKVTINGQARCLQIEPGAVLSDVLRETGLTGTKIGCREGHCGSCMVLVDGKPVNSCLVLAARVEGCDVTTIEGIGSQAAPHPIQQAFVDAGGVQCGYCTPGIIISTKALLDSNPNPSPEEVQDALSGNLCRCTGYTKIYDAVALAAKRMSKEAKS
jgi:carbon-monoxide dehydrogenase small subunit